MTIGIDFRLRLDNHVNHRQHGLSLKVGNDMCIYLALAVFISFEDPQYRSTSFRAVFEAWEVFSFDSIAFLYRLLPSSELCLIDLNLSFETRRLSRASPYRFSESSVMEIDRMSIESGETRSAFCRYLLTEA